MRWVLIGYMFLFIHRPFEVWPVLADLHIERVYMLCALLAVLVYALPFVVPFWVCNPSRTLRWFLAGYVALSVICVGLTGSRSSFIGLLLCAAVIILRSRWRWALLVLSVLAAPAMWAALPPSLQNRFETIIHPEVGPANAIESGEGRLVGLQKGFELFADNPLTGVGPGAWRPATGLAIESHNLYGQLLGEMGALGAATFAAVVVSFWGNLRAVRRAYRLHPE